MKKVKLGEILDVKRGTSLSGEYYSSTGEYIRLTLGNFNYPNGGFKENESKDDLFFTGNVRSEFILKKNDIITPLTEQVSGLLGETARIPESNKFIQSGDIGLIIPNEKYLDKSYAYYLVSSYLVKKQLDAGAQQTKIRHTSPEKIKDCIVWIPENLEYQRKSSALLDSITEKIETNNIIVKKLEENLKTIFNYWFLQFEFPNNDGKPYKTNDGKMEFVSSIKEELPIGWSVKKISEIAELYQPQTIGEKNFVDDGEYFVYGANGIVGKYNQYNHVNNEIAICCRGASCGKYLMTTPNSWITGNSMVVTPKDGFSKEYLYYSLSYEKIVPYITGSAQPQITRTNLEHMNIIVPPENLVKKFEDLAKDVRTKLDIIFEENSKLTSLKKYLTPLIINGQLKLD